MRPGGLQGSDRLQPGKAQKFKALQGIFRGAVLEVAS